MAFSDGRWNECKMCLKITWQAFLNLSPLAAFCYETPNTPAPKSPEPEPAETSNWHQMSEWMGSFGKKCQWAFTVTFHLWPLCDYCFWTYRGNYLAWAHKINSKLTCPTVKIEGKKKKKSWSTQGQKLRVVRDLWCWLSVFLQQYSTFLPEIRIHPGTIEQNTDSQFHSVLHIRSDGPSPSITHK